MMTVPIKLSKVSVLNLANLLEQVLKAAREESPLWVLVALTLIVVVVVDRPLYGVRLARACLSIGKYGPVVALQTLVNYRFADHLKDLLLLHILRTDEVVAEGLPPGKDERLLFADLCDALTGVVASSIHGEVGCALAYEGLIQ